MRDKLQWKSRDPAWRDQTLAFAGVTALATFHKTNKNDIKIEELFQYTSKQEIVKKKRDNRLFNSCLTVKLFLNFIFIINLLRLGNYMCRNAVCDNFKIFVKTLSSCDRICQNPML